MARVLLVGTGGTIASRALAAGGVGATDDGEHVLAGADVPAFDAAGITVETVDVLGANSFNLTLADLRSVRDAVGAALARDDVDGVVVTHGTDTMEETAALLAVTLRDDRPVVLTGAQRSADSLGSDGGSNLSEAISLAASAQSRGRGVLVSFSGEVLAPLGVRKAHTTTAQPFVNTMTPRLGAVGVAGVALEPVTSTTPATPTFAAPGAAFDNVRVDAVLTYPGGDARLLEAAVAAGAQGVVLVSTGTGNPGRALIPAIERAVTLGVLIAIASRTGCGPVRAIYGNGGAVDAEAAGAVLLGALPPSQARIIMALLLSQGGADDARRHLRHITQDR